MSYVLSLDGGGTKLIALVSDLKGHMIGEGRSGPTNMNFNSKEEIKESIYEALNRALLKNKVEKRKVEAVYAGMPVNGEFITCVVSEYLEHKVPVNVTGEFIPSLVGAIQTTQGGLALSGTGSFAAIRINSNEDSGMQCLLEGDDRGKYFTVGGWGSTMGDEGSGYDIGRKALIAFAEMIDERRPSSLLKEKVFHYFGTKDRGKIVEAVYSKDPGKQRSLIASLCPLVGECAKEGDLYSKEILMDAATQLAHQMMTVIKKAGVHYKIRVSVSGGVWKAHPILFETFSKQVQKELPFVTVQKPLFEPVVGGILLALHNSGFNIEAHLDHLKKEFASFIQLKWFS